MGSNFAKRLKRLKLKWMRNSVGSTSSEKCSPKEHTPHSGKTLPRMVCDFRGTVLKLSTYNCAGSVEGREREQ